MAGAPLGGGGQGWAIAHPNFSGGPKLPPKKAFFSFTKYTGTKLQLAISQNFETATFICRLT